MTDTKRNTAITTTTDGTTLFIAFAHGETLSISPGTLTPEIINRAIMHGLKAKLIDAAAISRNPETGRSATIVDKYDAVKTVFDRLIAGNWNAPRATGGGSGGGLLLQALVRMYSGRKTADELRRFLEGKSTAEKAMLRQTPKIAAIIDTIRAETAPKLGDTRTNELLAELDENDDEGYDESDDDADEGADEGDGSENSEKTAKTAKKKRH